MILLQRENKKGEKGLMKKLYVGNLPFDANEESLKTLFGECGSVASAKVITDMMTGKSRGFAFVEMTSDDEATNAIAKFNGYKIGEREIVVNEARPRKERSGGGGRGGSGGGWKRDSYDRGGMGRRY